MNTAYIDTSVLLAIEFGQTGARLAAEEVESATTLISSNLLEAELRSALARERRRYNPTLTSNVSWIHPDRSLNREFDLVLKSGYLRGTDLWHVAVALFVSPDPSQITFITLDDRQREVADEVGFQTHI